MSSIVIKNGILALFLILIVHFTIKNIVTERHLLLPTTSSSGGSSGRVGANGDFGGTLDTPVASSSLQHRLNNEQRGGRGAESSSIISTSTAGAASAAAAAVAVDPSANELLKYVFEDAASNLENQAAGIDSVLSGSDMPSGSSFSSFSSALPSATVSATSSASVRGGGGAVQFDSAGTRVVTTYKNDRVMNGGLLSDDGLRGFEGYGDRYVVLDDMQQQ